MRTLAPDIAALANAAKHCVIVTAPGHEVDFVSRMFGPHYGVDEDPVTGFGPLFAGAILVREDE